MARTGLSRVSRLKVRKEIQRLSKEIEDILKEISRKRDDFSEAFKVYGSELAGPNYGDLPERLGKARIRKEMFEKFLRGRTNLNTKVVKSRIKRLESELASEKDKLRNVEEIKVFLNPPSA